MNTKRPSVVFFWVLRNLSNHMDRQTRTGETVLAISLDMTGRTQTLSWVAGGKRGKGDRKQNTLVPLYYTVLLYQGVTKRCRLSCLTLVYEPKCRGRGELRGLSL